MPPETLKIAIDIYWGAYSEFKKNVKNEDKARALTNDFFLVFMTSLLKVNNMNTNTEEIKKQSSDQFISMLLNGGWKKDE